MIGTMGTHKYGLGQLREGVQKDSAHLPEDSQWPRRVPQVDVALSIEIYK
jgi:hypothetical protein